MFLEFSSHVDVQMPRMTNAQLLRWLNSVLILNIWMWVQPQSRIC